MDKKQNGSDSKFQKNVEGKEGKLEGDEIYIAHDKSWKKRENEWTVRNWLKGRTQEEKNVANVRHNKVIIGETEWQLEEEEGQMKVFIPRKRREEGGTGEKAAAKDRQT